MPAIAPTKLPMRTIALIALLGTMVCVTLTIADYTSTKGTLGGLIAQDPKYGGNMLPEDELDGPPGAYGGGHDGRYFYAIARDFPNLSAAAPNLDRPAYRFQRILFPALARLLHPVGNGPGLIWTMFAIGVIGVFLAGFATGCLAAQLGGSLWVAAIPPMFFGSWVSLRITVPDPLALGLALGAVVLSMRSRHRWALVAGIAAALTRDTSVIILIGYALWRRDRRSVVLAAVPAGTILLWAVALRLMHFPTPSGEDVVEFTWPLQGLWLATTKFWFTYDPDSATKIVTRYEPLGWISLFPAIALGVAGLVRRGLRHPVGWMLVGQLAVLLVVKVDVLGPERNASRMALPLIALGLVSIVTPRAPDRAAVQRAGP